MARLISDCGAIIHETGLRATPGQRGLAAMICERDATVTFDVHDVRSAAEAMLREAIEVEQVFADWTRERGKGPENRESRAFILDRWRYVALRSTRIKLIDRGWEVGTAEAVANDVPKFAMCLIGHEGGWPGNLARHPDNPCPSWAPMAKSRHRFARRVLAAIEGQPSECQGCDGLGKRPWDDPDLHAEALADGRTGLPLCPDCHGTSHNIHGTLPRVEWAPVVRRKVSEAERCGTPPHGIQMPWTSRVQDALGGFTARVDGEYHPLDSDGWGEFSTVLADGTVLVRSETRVDPTSSRKLGRGAHNDYPLDVRPEDILARRATGDEVECLDVRISARRWWVTAHPVGGTREVPLAPGVQGPRRRVPLHSRLPAWARGDIRHASQRRSSTALTFRGQLMGFADSDHDDMPDALRRRARVESEISGVVAGGVRFDADGIAELVRASSRSFDTDPGLDFTSVLDHGRLPRLGETIGGARVEALEVTGTTDGITRALATLSTTPVRELRVDEEFAIPPEDS